MKTPTLTSSLWAKPPQVCALGQSIIKIELPASAPLHTRRGNLLALKGDPSCASTTLSVLNPLTRIPRGIPFLYQKFISTEPCECYISTPKKTCCAILNLNGLSDWTITRRNALLSWTGASIFLTPLSNWHGSVGQWGNTRVSGRGSVVLASRGECFTLSLSGNEQYIVLRSNVLAFTSESAPQPFLLANKRLSFSLPKMRLGSFLLRWEFFRVMRDTDTWKMIMSVVRFISGWSRKRIRSEQEFWRFQGPGSVVVQSNASFNEVANDGQVIVESAAESSSLNDNRPPGTRISTPRLMSPRVSEASKPKIAEVVSGDVTIKDVDDFKAFMR